MWGGVDLINTKFGVPGVWFRLWEDNRGGGGEVVNYLDFEMKGQGSVRWSGMV